MKRAIGHAWLGLFGWRCDGPPPPYKKFVLIAAPHTTGWDLPFMLATSYVMDVPISWMGKHTLFQPPFGWLMRALGGIPIDRRSRHNVVKQAVELFNASEDLVLAVPAEGTRARVELWKSGFYHIARGANVPIGLGFLDFEKKVCGLVKFITPTDDVRADMDQIREFYRNIRGKYPELESEPRLREEMEAAAPGGEAAAAA
ncbi:MAG: lysophospholipid acyltransferase family protein [Polyangiaceae bacterium]|nr:lysophospholipid acyltransferase family protein [Polyangiaceae bacterium]